jgi:hypothetical protein
MSDEMSLSEDRIYRDRNVEKSFQVNLVCISPGRCVVEGLGIKQASRRESIQSPVPINKNLSSQET